jgi:hypothetical protein
MLKTFQFENFYSFPRPIHISLEANHSASGEGPFFVSPKGFHASKCLAVIGGNASGKTQFLRALAFVHWFMGFSVIWQPGRPDFFRQEQQHLPLHPHFSATDRSSSFQLEFEHNGKAWRYCLEVTRDRVLHESLHSQDEQTSRFSNVFTRDWDRRKQIYTIKLKRQHAELQSARIPQTDSMIPVALEYGVDLAENLASANVKCSFGPRSADDIRNVATFYADNPAIRDGMVALLTGWDLGLSGVRFEEQSTTHWPKGTLKQHVPYGLHRFRDQEHRLALEQESVGTQNAFLLLSCILPALQDGGLVLFDGLGADLHPHLTHAILNLFLSPETNPRNAQIVFTGHSMELLNILQKNQVVLVEKNERSESDAWRLDSLKGVRSSDNFYARYLAGTYGAVPRI